MRLRHGFGMVLFCLLSGSAWLVDGAFPQTLPPLLGWSLRLALIALLALGVSLARGRRVPLVKGTMRLALASLLLSAVPFVLAEIASAIRHDTSVALYALVPLLVVLVVSFRGDEAARAWMVPALGGLAGVLLLLPWQMPSNLTAALAFAEMLLAVVSTVAASVWIHQLLRGERLAPAVLAVAVTNTIALGLSGLARGERLRLSSGLALELLRALFFDLPQLLLLVWLLRHVAPERYAVRFFLVPLVTILEGFFLLHASLDLRTATGILLLLAASGWLLFGQPDVAPRLNLR